MSVASDRHMTAASWLIMLLINQPFNKPDICPFHSMGSIWNLVFCVYEAFPGGS